MSRSRWDAIAERGAIKSLFGVKKNSNSASDTRAHRRHEGTWEHQRIYLLFYFFILPHTTNTIIIKTIIIWLTNIKFKICRLLKRSECGGEISEKPSLWGTYARLTTYTSDKTSKVIEDFLRQIQAKWNGKSKFMLTCTYHAAARTWGWGGGRGTDRETYKKREGVHVRDWICPSLSSGIYHISEWYSIFACCKIAFGAKMWLDTILHLWQGDASTYELFHLFLKVHSFPRTKRSENGSLFGTDNIRGDISKNTVHFRAKMVARAANSKVIQREGVWWRGAKKVISRLCSKVSPHTG